MNGPSRASSAAPVVLVTGRPGIGKTTVIRRIVAAAGTRAAGFYTREVREGSRRTGFELVTLSGETALLATVDTDVPLGHPVSFGRYRIDLEAIDAVGVPALIDALRQGLVAVVDEIGPMEIRSPRFRDAILSLLESDAPVVGTVYGRPERFADRVKAHPRVTVHTITMGNRDALPARLLAELRPWICDVS